MRPLYLCDKNAKGIGRIETSANSHCVRIQQIIKQSACLTRLPTETLMQIIEFLDADPFARLCLRATNRRFRNLLPPLTHHDVLELQYQWFRERLSFWEKVET